MIISIPFTQLNTVNPVTSLTNYSTAAIAAPFLWRVPENVTTITVECFGGSSASGYAGTAYSKGELSVTTGTNVWIMPGHSSHLNNDPRFRGNSWVSLTSNVEPMVGTANTSNSVKACGGHVTPNTHIALGIGQIKYRGGNNGDTAITQIDYGGETGIVTTYHNGGRGGAAGPNGNGGNGAPSTTTVLGGGGGANGGTDAIGNTGGTGRFANVIGSGGNGGSGPIGNGDVLTETSLPVYILNTAGGFNQLKESYIFDVLGGQGGTSTAQQTPPMAGSAMSRDQGRGAVLITFNTTAPGFAAVFGVDNGGTSLRYQAPHVSEYGTYDARTLSTSGGRANTWSYTDTWIKLPPDVPSTITVECFNGVSLSGGGSYSKSNVIVSPNQSIFIGGLFQTASGDASFVGTFVNTLANAYPTLANGSAYGCLAASGNVFTQEERSIGDIKYRGGLSGTALSFSNPPAGESPGTSYYYFGGRGGQAGPNGRGGDGSPAYMIGGAYYPGAGGGANGGGNASNNIPGVNRFGTYGRGAGSNSAPIVTIPGWGSVRANLRPEFALTTAELLYYTDSAFGNTTVPLFGGAAGYVGTDSSTYGSVGYFVYHTYNKVVLSYSSTATGQVQTLSYAYIIE
jgi:hypothetical protein